MIRKICVQCKKEEVRNPQSKVCSDPCRASLRRSGALKRTAEVARIRREKIGKIDFDVPYDVSKLKVGEVVAFGIEVGTIIARVEPGESIRQVWERLLEENPGLYSVHALEPSNLPLSTPRYIVLVEKTKRAAVKWPYLYSIKGVVHGHKEEQNKAREETKAT